MIVAMTPTISMTMRRRVVLRRRIPLVLHRRRQTGGVKLRPIIDTDIPTIVRLNDAAAPAVPITSAEEMGALLAVSGFTFAVAEELVEEASGTDAEPLAFLIGMLPGADYASENYRFFEARGTNSLYVDRIVVGEASRGSGIGRRLYDAVFELARSQVRDEVTCEVNLEPPNPGSLAFHDRLGFRRVGEQSTKGGDYVVALLAAPVSSATD